MVMSDYRVTTTLAEWRCSLMDAGGQCVMTGLVSVKQRWCADSWDTLRQWSMDRQYDLGTYKDS